ncbi:MAG: cysteine peptidase family C39 domain-containing protein, partial [Nitrospira sp.]|nr:cysteine peptidase family C39 domain-containing protein [Nitrospira sp.]
MNNSGAQQVHNTSASSVNGSLADSGLTCLLIIARFHDLPGDGSQLRHQFARSGQVFSDADILRAAKHVGLKAGLLKTAWSKLQRTPLPAMVKRTDGRYVVLAKVQEEKALVQDPVEARPLALSREQ